MHYGSTLSSSWSILARLWTASCTNVSSLPGPMRGYGRCLDCPPGLRSPRDCARLTCGGLGACSLCPNEHIHHNCNTAVSQPVLRSATASASVACRLMWSCPFLFLCPTCLCPCPLLCLPCLLCRLCHQGRFDERHLPRQCLQDAVCVFTPLGVIILCTLGCPSLIWNLPFWCSLVVPMHIFGVIMHISEATEFHG